jgi:hypothetical protein
MAVASRAVLLKQLGSVGWITARLSRSGRDRDAGQRDHPQKSF